MSLAIVLIGTLGIELSVLWRLRFDRVVIGIVLTGTLLYVDYLSYTTASERNYDGASHLAYIQSIASTRHLPDALSCVACGHPPLYYALGALWSKLLLMTGWPALELGLQWLSLLLFFAFIAVSLCVFRSCTKRVALLRLAAALVVFWPSSVIHSVRVHNDALASPLMLAAAYFTAEWDKHDRPRHFYAALAMSVLALTTKASGCAPSAVLLLFAFMRLRSPEKRSRAIARLTAAAIALGTTAVLNVVLRASRAPRTPCQMLLGAACNGRYVPPVPDSATRFLSFHVHDFVGRLALFPEDPFLNRVAKSSLFGVMPLGEPFTAPRYELLGRCISWDLLAMVTVCFLGLPLLDRASLRENRVYIGSVVVMALLLLAFRLRAPNEFHEDFRHIFAALTPFCLAYASMAARLGRYSKLTQYAAVALALLMVALSIAFFARPQPA